MTDKSQQILNRMREKERRKRVLGRLDDPRHRNRLLDSFNQSTLDDAAAPLRNGQMTILREMEKLDLEHGQYMQGL